jgi:hypothetical protein
MAQNAPFLGLEGLNTWRLSMKVGDLVQNWADGVGVLIRKVSDFDGDVWWLVQWLDGQRDTLNERLMEVISESR